MKLSGFICAFSSLVILNTVPLSAFSQTTSPSITSADLRQRMNILASDSLAGRRTGEPGCESAARYIAKEFKRMGLRPLDPAKSYFQHYDFSERAFDSTKKEKTKAVNVIGFIPGSSKKLKDQV
ncbi:MAG: hypothetical protein Q8896_14450, partial [Bacteroidota bacterium]|nr:hypothetical protein [Bacteroidota bacterium]